MFFKFKLRKNIYLQSMKTENEHFV